MNATHNYKLEIGDITFKGDIEMNNAGLVALKETSGEHMSDKYHDALRSVLEILGQLPEKYDDLKTFKLELEEQE